MGSVRIGFVGLFVAVDIFMKYIGARIVKVVWDILVHLYSSGICINPYKKDLESLSPKYLGFSPHNCK